MLKNRWFQHLSAKNNLYLALLDISLSLKWEAIVYVSGVSFWVLLLRREVVFATGSVSSGSRCAPVIGDGKGMFVINYLTLYKQGLCIFERCLLLVYRK